MIRSRLALLAAALCAAAVLLGATLALAAAPKASWGFGAAHTRLKGTVLPEGKATAWSFAYIPDNLYQQNLAELKPGFQGATTAGSGTVSGSTKEGQVEARIDPNTLTHGLTYHVRLRVENEDGSFEATSTANSETGFTAASQPPSATTLPATHVLPYLAVLSGAVNPNGDPTAVWFQYGTEDCESSACTAVPANEEADAEHGSAALPVAQTLSGLQPETTYHYRLLAENSAGLTLGADQTFTTPPAPASEACPNEARREEQHAAYLPDCRAYEMVSPADKNGGNLIPDSALTQATSDGQAIEFASLTPFGKLQGSSVSTEYIAERSSEGPGPSGTGWSSHGITPVKDAISYKLIIGNHFNLDSYRGEFSEGLAAGVYFASNPLTEDPDVANVTNLYLESGLRGPGTNTSQLVTACPLCRETDETKGAGLGALPAYTAVGNAEQRIPEIDALSPNAHLALFESGEPLTADAPSSNLPHLYEWKDGTVRLAGRVPSGTATECDDAPGAAIPACKRFGAPSSNAGDGASRHVLSDDTDGHTRVFFTFSTENGSSPSIGTLRYGPGRLYLREDGHYTAELDRPEGVASSFKPAKFWDASANGERVFFTTEQALTEDAPPEGKKLYMYDASKPGSDLHNLTLISVDHEPADGTTPRVEGVIGANRDGSYVYFVAQGQLVAGAPPGNATQLYLWHEGTLRFVASVPGGSFRDLVGEGGLKQSRISPDGTHLLFSEPLINGSIPKLMLYDAAVLSPATPALVCLSCPPDGGLYATGSFSAVESLRSVAYEGDHENHPLSDDGRYVFFSTAQPLVPEDTNGVEDAYSYDSQTGKVSLLSSGTSEYPSWFLDASADGKNAFIMTTQPLLGWDRDHAYDLYDVRVGGGFPEPAPQAAPCDPAVTCPKPLDPVPIPATVASGSQLAGNPKEHPKTCPKGRHPKKVKGHTVCAKPKHHKHKGHHRR